MGEDAAIEPPTENAELADYQARLLEFLNDSMGRIDPGDLRSIAGPYSEKMQELDPDLLEIAADLTRSWGRLG